MDCPAIPTAFTTSEDNATCGKSEVWKVEREAPVSMRQFLSGCFGVFLDKIAIRSRCPSDFNHPDICWKSNTASCRQSRRFLECLDDNFLRQEIDSPTQGEAILDLIVTDASELIRDVKTGGSLGCSDHALVEFTVLRDTCQTRGIVRTLNFRKANLQLFKELVNRTPWEAVLRDKGAEQSWQTFKDAFHRAQELSIPRCKKSSKKGKRPAWLSQDLLVKVKDKKEWHRQFRQEQVSWEEYRDAARLCRDDVRKAKVRLELNLARDAKDNKKGFYRYVNQKRKVEESMPLLMGKNVKLVTTDEENAEVLNNFFASVFTANLSPLFRKDRLGRRGGGVALYIKDQLECMGLQLWMDEDPTESLWVKIKGSTGAGDVTVGVCYRPLDQGDRVDEALYRQLGAALHSQTLVLTGGLQPRRYLLEGQHSRAQEIQEVLGMCR
ncbi:nedd4-binding protein 2-like 2 [Limosa lapponica baueri]|uniref:Nedd4-binding protein 2-like 2 n=1 Tax=Limosa lapponica baueri TaxID=1758121 RepID=A0A2I0TFV8_LIMLA|nr:nedd4-binding protein 2-like 2 [Limosa lapponica baueri]